MRILLKCPTRSRPAQFLKTLKEYVSLANRPDLLGVCVSCDSDDTTMTPAEIQYGIKNITYPTAWCEIYYGKSKNKIEAVNANMEIIPWMWDIVILVSDDMVPQIKGYDDVIRSNMLANFPDTDGIIWTNDGTQSNKLNTLSILGRKMYESFVYIYHPSYKSLFCDTEFTDLCNGPLKQKCTYVDYLLVRHEHPGTGFSEKLDELYTKNQTYWTEDMYNYISRKKYDYDWSILIPTIPGREEKLHRLLKHIHELRNKICPELKIDISILFDNRESSVGVKRQKLLDKAAGKYISFVDDDDDLTPAYFEDALACIKGNYHVCRLRGIIKPYTFTHSIDIPYTGMMAVGDVFVRPPNHLNITMADVARFVKFDDLKNGEDFDWAIKMAKYGFLTKEYQSDSKRIHYIYNVAQDVTPRVIEIQRDKPILTMAPSYTTAIYPPQHPLNSERTIRFTAKGFVSK